MSVTDVSVDIGRSFAAIVTARTFVTRLLIAHVPRVSPQRVHVSEARATVGAQVLLHRNL